MTDLDHGFQRITIQISGHIQDIHDDPFLPSSIDPSCPRKVYELVAEFIKLARSQLLKKVTFNSCYTSFILSRASSFFFLTKSKSAANLSIPFLHLIYH